MVINTKQVFLLEDDLNISNMIVEMLESTGFIAKAFSDYRLFFDMIRVSKPDIILLDLMLPMVSGEEVLKYLKGNLVMHNIPVIIISGRSDEKDKVMCLDGGADDYISKPFSLKELVSRINAVLRRFGSTNNLVYENIEIDINNRILILNNQNIILTKKEFELLLYLIQRIDVVVTKEELISKFWKDSVEHSRSIDMHIKSLRHKVFDYTTLEITTILKVGFKLTKRQEKMLG